MIYCNFDQHKREGYATDFCNSNFENNFNAVIAGISIEKDYINSSCIYNNIDNRRQNSTLQFLSTIGNIKATTSNSDPPILTIVFYCNKNLLILLNN